MVETIVNYYAELGLNLCPVYKGNITAPKNGDFFIYVFKDEIEHVNSIEVAKQYRKPSSPIFLTTVNGDVVVINRINE